MARERDHKAIYERRQERARAKGFTGLGQQRRAKTEGYGERPAAYRAAVETRHAHGGVTRAVAKGKLLGVARTRTGSVFSAKGSQLAALERAVNRFGPSHRIAIDVETPTGEVIHLGEHGGYSPAWIAAQGGLADAIREMIGHAYKGNIDTSWLDEIELDEDELDEDELDEETEGDGDSAVITVTVV